MQFYEENDKLQRIVFNMKIFNSPHMYSLEHWSINFMIFNNQRLSDIQIADQQGYNTVKQIWLGTEYFTEDTCIWPLEYHFLYYCLT